MTEDPDDITVAYAEDGSPAVLVDEDLCTSAADLVAAVPWLLAPEHATLAAQVLNHLEKDQSFVVIDDPADFAEWFRATYADEPAEVVAPDGAFGLRQFGMPDLASITAPRLDGGVLHFFAFNREIGAPYRVAMPVTPPGKADYMPMDMEADE